MAVTSIHPIKATISYAIDYVINPSKTDEKLLVTGIHCIPETAAKEFALTRQFAKRKGENLGWHLMQSFAPNEITDTKKAHEIGIELARNTFGDKYEFIVSTHIDKNHIHNHIIFNSVDRIDNKYYVSNYKTLYDIRNKSDKLCKENNLSVIKNPKKSFGKKDFNKKQAEKNNFRSTNEKTIYDIRISTNKAKTIEEFYNNLEKLGYEIKITPKNITLKHKTMERGRRLSTLSKSAGEDFSIEAIEKRISDSIKYSKIELGDIITEEEASGDIVTDKEKIEKDTGKIRIGKKQKLSLQNQLKLSYNSLPYEEKKERLEMITATIKFISANQIESRQEIENQIGSLSNEETGTRAILQVLEDKINKLTDGYLLSKKYLEVKEKVDIIAAKKQKSNSEKTILEANIKVVNKIKTDIKELGFSTLSEATNAIKDIKELKYARIELVDNYSKIKEKKKNYLTVKYNVSEIDNYKNNISKTKKMHKENRKNKETSL